MAVAFIEHRPHASSGHVPTSHYVIVADGKETGAFSTKEKVNKKLALRDINQSMSHGNDIYKIVLNQLIGE
ncbi:MAG: hypothetical protein EPO58_08845 [Chitinophagaceae bacterium]|nr:MAG: hypothetical protein EPO58_08845 [Chitinophagaceae bacterium]